MTDALRDAAQAALDALIELEYARADKSEAMATAAIASMRAALAAPPAAPPVPAGMALVPVEATPAMCKAAVIFANGNAVYKNVAAEALKIEESIYGEAYAAMLAAAAHPVPATGAQPEPAPTRADLVAALTFYANGDHFHTDEAEDFDSVSGEPPNWLCSGLDDSATMIEDGTIAKRTLAGQLTAAQIESSDDDDEPVASPTAPTGSAT